MTISSITSLAVSTARQCSMYLHLFNHNSIYLPDIMAYAAYNIELNRLITTFSRNYCYYLYVVNKNRHPCLPWHSETLQNSFLESERTIKLSRQACQSTHFPPQKYSPIPRYTHCERGIKEGASCRAPSQQSSPLHRFAPGAIASLMLATGGMTSL